MSNFSNEITKDMTKIEMKVSPENRKQKKISLQDWAVIKLSEPLYIYR